MSSVLHHKYVGSLPGELDADSVYYVRSGAGFDIYVTNATGTVVAYPLNQTGGGGSTPVSVVAADFGAAPGKSSLRLPVTDASITATSKVEAWLHGSTADHNEIEHAFIPVRISAVERAAGVGFTLFIASDLRLTGSFNIAYRITG